MTELNSLVPVTVECPCPGTPHPDGDEVSLYPTLPFRASVVILRKIGAGISDTDEATGMLMEQYLLNGIAEWTLIGADGKRLPVDRSTIAAFAAEHIGPALVVADAADTLYTAGLFGPLAVKARKSSPPSPIGASTSVNRRSSANPRRSKRSSISTTDTAPLAG